MAKLVQIFHREQASWLETISWPTRGFFNSATRRWTALSEQRGQVVFISNREVAESLQNKHSEVKTNTVRILLQARTYTRTKQEQRLGRLWLWAKEPWHLIQVPSPVTRQKRTVSRVDHV